MEKYTQGLVLKIAAGIDQLPQIRLCGADNFSPVVAVITPDHLIVYDRNTFRGMAVGGGRNEAALLLMSHEIGHLLLGHGTARSDAEIRKAELAADEFAGYALRQLELDAGVAARVFNVLLPTDRAYGKYPSRSARIAAVERGFRRGKPPATLKTLADDIRPEEQSEELDAAVPSAAPSVEQQGNESATPAKRWSLLRAILDGVKNTMEYIAGVAAGLGAIYAGYLWLRKRVRRKRSRLNERKREGGVTTSTKHARAPIED